MENDFIKIPDNSYLNPHQNKLFVELIVVIGGVPSAGFLSPRDCKDYLIWMKENNPKLFEQTKVISAQYGRNCYGQVFTAKIFIRA